MKNINQNLNAFGFLMVLIITSIAHTQIKETATLEGITEYQLENGLKVLLFPDNSSQTILIMLTMYFGFSLS